MNREREELEQMKASQLKAAKEIEQKKATLHKQKMDEEIKTRALEEAQRHVGNEQSKQNNIAKEKEHVQLKETMDKIQRERERERENRRGKEARYFEDLKRKLEEERLELRLREENKKKVKQERLALLKPQEEENNWL